MSAPPLPREGHWRDPIAHRGDNPHAGQEDRSFPRNCGKPRKTRLITIPMAVYGVNMLGSVWGGSLRLTAPMVWALGVIALFGSGGFGGIFLDNATADMQLHDTYFVVGHFHLMIGGVTLFATFAGFYYWFPKMFGRSMHEGLGKAHFWATFIPFFTVFFAQHFQGLEGMPRRYYAFLTYEFLRVPGARAGAECVHLGGGDRADGIACRGLEPVPRGIGR